jgi:hypothetical protein
MSFDSSKLPMPVFILQNSKQMNCVRFSDVHQNLLFTGNRAGDFSIYNLELRRNIFSENPNKEAILTVAELDESSWLSSSRDGSIFRWTACDNSTWEYKCNLIGNWNSYSIQNMFMSCKIQIRCVQERSVHFLSLECELW